MKRAKLLVLAGIACGLALAGCRNSSSSERMSTVPAASGDTSAAGVGGTTSVPSADQARTSGR